jgi:hypothetical protein
LTLPRTSTLDLNFFHWEGTDVSALDLRICKEEVWDTIGSLLAYRAPGPDGYTGRFYKPCWQLIKTDFMGAITVSQQGNSRNAQLSIPHSYSKEG